MDLAQRLHEDMKAALKSGQKERLGVIRMLLSDVKNIDLASKPTTAEQAVEAYGKKLRKGMEEYQKLGKPDEVAKFKWELEIVQEYLPRKASAEQTQKLIDVFLATSKFTPLQAGQAMGAFMKQHGSEVDPAIANPLIRKALAGTV